MPRLKSLSVAVTAVGLVCGLTLPALAQDALPEGVTLDVKANGLAETLPEDLDQVVLFRMVLAPEAVFPLEPEPASVALVEVETGSLTTTVDGVIDITRADAEPTTVESIAANVPFTLAEGDSAVFPARLSGEIANEGEEDVSLLIIEAVNSTSGAEESDELPDDITVTLLAGGPAPDLDDGQALFWLGEFSLAPGAGFAGEAQPGVELAVGLAGEFTLAPTVGPGLAVMRQLGAAVEAGEEPSTAMAEPGDTLMFAEGDAVYFPQGNAVEISNEGQEAASAIFGGVGPAPSDAG